MSEELDLIELEDYANELARFVFAPEVPPVQAVQAGHEFVYDNLNERLATARRRIEALLGQLANPK